jgi:hypothetical protein
MQSDTRAGHVQWRLLRGTTSCILSLGLCALLPSCTGLAPPGAAATTSVGNQFDGDYSGIMTGVPGHDVGCRPTERVEGMHVSGGRVSFGLFGGPIGLDGKVQMEARFEWLTGQFTGNRFSGQVMPQGEGCWYHMELERAG